MNPTEQDKIREAVRQDYARVAETGGDCCDGPSCCGSDPAQHGALAVRIGYTPEDTTSVPEGANMALGCGNPQAIAGLSSGETVLDLGSGGGFDCFLAAAQVGTNGHVIGVDMTASMVSKARANALQGGYSNVDFRLGEIENLPVADGIVDVIISNCVINLSPDKPRVFNEAFRVLRPGGRLAVSDVVAFAPIPEPLRGDTKLLTGCMAGASLISDLETMLTAAGFEQVRIEPKDESKAFISDWAPGTDITEYVVSANIQAVKPGT
ncbi:MAG: arsenite methyltransferase [Gammaproteobacteria bacterium]